MGESAEPLVTNEASLHYHGWRVVVTCFAAALFSWGLGFYGQGIYLAELQQRQGWSPALISSATTTYYLSGALLVTFVGDQIARIGPRFVVLIGISFLGVSTLLVGWVQEPWQLFADYGLMAVGWAALSVAAITTILSKWFQERRGLAISLALNGASAGGIVVTPALLSLIHYVGFRSALLYASITMMLVVAPMALFWLRWPPSNPRGARTLDYAVAHPRSESAAWTRQRALRSASFWTVSAPFALALFAQVGFLVHQIAFLGPTIGRGAAGTAVVLTAAMAMAGRVMLGAVFDRLDQRIVSAVSLVTQAAALVAMTLVSETIPLFMACAVFGFSVGNVVILPALIVHREFPNSAFATLIALSTAIGQFTYAFAPGLVGLLRGTTGSYHLSLLVCATLDLVAAGIVIIPARTVRPE